MVMAESVLVVEDESVLLELAQEILELEAIRTFGAANAHEALIILERESEIGLVITDIKMPGKISGFELAWLIAEKWPKIPVLVTSGHQTIRSDELPPHSHFLPKPWLITTFLGKSKEMLLNSKRLQKRQPLSQTDSVGMQNIS
ncbi:response regulator [Pseudomonas sp. CFSAN084952]|nr:response regulator [Pseudomonas sp. CFSAN084952]